MLTNLRVTLYIRVQEHVVGRAFDKVIKLDLYCICCIQFEIVIKASLRHSSKAEPLNDFNV